MRLGKSGTKRAKAGLFGTFRYRWVRFVPGGRGRTAGCQRAFDFTYTGGVTRAWWAARTEAVARGRNRGRFCRIGVGRGSAPRGDLGGVGSRRLSQGRFAARNPVSYHIAPLVAGRRGGEHDRRCALGRFPATSGGLYEAQLAQPDTLEPIRRRLRDPSHTPSDNNGNCTRTLRSAPSSIPGAAPMNSLSICFTSRIGGFGSGRRSGESAPSCLFSTL